MYGLKNNATSKLTAGITSSATSITITAGEGQLFVNNSIATLEHKDSDGNVIKREIVLISNISTDTLTIERAYGPCVIDDTAEDKEMQAVAQSFSVGDTLSIYLASEVIQDLYTPAQQVACLCTCICNCHDSRMQQACQKMLDCYGDISYGTGCDGDCVLSGCVYLDATKEYEFRNLTICAGACVRFVGSGIPKIHVSGNFISDGIIDLRGGCPVGTNSFTNCFGTVSNNYCATCYNAMKYGCGGCGGTSPYTTLTDGPHGGNGGNANSSGNGNGGTGGTSNTAVASTHGGNGSNGSSGRGGGGGGGSGLLLCSSTFSFTGDAGCNGDGMNGGNGGSTLNCNWSSCRVVSGIGGGGGGGGFRTGNGGNGGIGVGSCVGTSNRKNGGNRGGNGGNGGIWGCGGNGGDGRVYQATTCGFVGCCNQYGGLGGDGGNGFLGGTGGTGSLFCNISSAYTGRTTGGKGGKGVVAGGNGGGVNFRPATGCCISYACAGNGGDAINNMYSFVLRARNYCNCIICGTGGKGGNGGSVCCNGNILTSGTNIIGGNGGNGGNGANIMIFYKCNLRTGTITCAGGTGGTKGCGATCGTAGTNGSAGSLIFCQRNQ